MYKESKVLKNSFIQFTATNTRVIDPNALMAKRMEGFTGVLRERSETDDSSEGAFDESGQVDPVDALTGDSSSDEFVPISFSGPSADELIADAKAQAEEIVAAANNEAEAVRQAAHDEGFEAGYSEGREKALSELLLAKKELEGEKNAIIEEYNRFLSDAEPKMVEVITDIYEHVFGSNFFSRRDVMVCLINRALLHSNADNQIVIHICPADYDMLVGMKSLLFDKVPLRSEPEIRQRDDFTKGQAKIETPYGLIDCSIDTELKELKRILTMLSYEGHGDV